MVQQEARPPEAKAEDAKAPNGKPKPKAKPLSDDDQTLFKVKMMRRMLRAESEKVGYQIRLSPEFIAKYDEMIRALYADALARMKASGAKTLMLEHA